MGFEPLAFARIHKILVSKATFSSHFFVTSDMYRLALATDYAADVGHCKQLPNFFETVKHSYFCTFWFAK